MLRKAQEKARQRYEEIKKGDKMYLMNMDIPNVVKNPEKFV